MHFTRLPQSGQSIDAVNCRLLSLFPCLCRALWFGAGFVMRGMPRTLACLPVESFGKILLCTGVNDVRQKRKEKAIKV